MPKQRRWRKVQSPSCTELYRKFQARTQEEQRFCRLRPSGNGNFLKISIASHLRQPPLCLQFQEARVSSSKERLSYTRLCSYCLSCRRESASTLSCWRLCGMSAFVPPQLGFSAMWVCWKERGGDAF